MNLAAAAPSSAEHASFLLALLLVAGLFYFAARRVAGRRRHTHSEVVPGDVRRDLHAIVAAIDGIPKVHVTNVDQWGAIHAQQSALSISVELRQKEPATMEVTVTIRTPGHGGQQKLLSQVMQAIYSAQERWSRPKPPFGPSPVT
jgi:hypothetical protein